MRYYDIIIALCALYVKTGWLYNKNIITQVKTKVSTKCMHFMAVLKDQTLIIINKKTQPKRPNQRPKGNETQTNSNRNERLTQTSNHEHASMPTAH